jgi:hypothetical protein
MTTNNEQNGTKQSVIFPRACALALTALFAVGCGAEGDEDLASAALEKDVPCGEEGEEDADSGALPPETDGGNHTPNPSGSYFASVTANGTGCPAGTWETVISPDGKAFTTKFNAYEAKVDASSTIAVKNCQVTVKLHSPRGQSYRVKKFAFDGHAFLEEGVKARYIAQYYFQGNPVASEQIRVDLAGPVDERYVFEDTLHTTASAVWSPCSVDRNLNINTTLRLQSGDTKKTGRVKVDNVLGLELEWRACDAGPTEPKPSEPKPTEPKPSEPKPTEPKAPPIASKPDAATPATATPDAGAPKPRSPRGWWGGRGR